MATATCILLTLAGPRGSLAAPGDPDPAAQPGQAQGSAASFSVARAPSARPAPALFTKRDLWLGLGAVGATALVTAGDDWFRDRAMGGDSQGAHDLSRTVKPLGSPWVMSSAMIVVYGAARLAHQDSLEHVAFRAGLAVGVAAGTAYLVKEITGRYRPFESPDDPYRFSAFSGHKSFPSGHAAVAFAAATALSRETGSRWVPWVAFPVATLVCWSRVHDDLHWTSDVVAGAALGAFVSGKTEDFLRKRRISTLKLSMEPRATGWRMAIDFAHPAPAARPASGGSWADHRHRGVAARKVNHLGGNT